VVIGRFVVVFIASVSKSGEPHATIIFYVADDNFNIHFLTRVDTRKFDAIKMNPKVAITVATADIPQTLQIEGNARSIAMDDTTSSMKPQLFEVLNSNHWFNAPLTKQDMTMVHEMRIEPTWIRWSDYAFEQDGNEHVFKVILDKK
jgi:general stress protein 26